MGSVTGCVAMITASACRVLGWVHAKNARPESASAHDFGSAPDTPDLAGIASRKDSQGARTAGGLGCAGGLPVDHRTGCCAGEDENAVLTTTEGPRLVLADRKSVGEGKSVH